MADLFASVDLPLCPRSKHAPTRTKQPVKKPTDPDPWFVTGCPVCAIGCGASTQESADIAWRTLAERWGR
jgi:hypothetical protein